MRKILTFLFTLITVLGFSQGITVTVGGISGASVANADSLGNKGAAFYVDTLNDQNIEGLKVFKDDLVLDSTLSIGVSIPDGSAILHISSTTKGFLPPRMTPTQRDAISIPANGLMIYDSIADTYNFRKRTDWKKFVFTPANTLSTIGALAFVIDTGEIHGDVALIWDSILKRLDVGASTSITTLNVTGIGGASVGGFPSGASQITSPSTLVNANAVITGHNSFGGNKQLWYLGSASSSNDDVTLLNRQLGSLFLGTNGITRITIEDAGDVVFENQIRIKGGTPGLGKVLTSDAVGIATWSAAGSGDVSGPASSTDNALARYDLTTGKIIQNSLGILTDAGALSGLTQLTTDNVRLDGNTVSSTTGDLDITTGSGGVFKFNADALFAGLDGANQLELGHGGSNAFVNNTGSGGIDFRFTGSTLASFTTLGHLHLTSTLDLKHNIKLITNNNLNSTGIAWENSGGNFSQTIFREDVGSNRSDLVFAIGSNADIDLLTSSFKIHGSAANEGRLEILDALQISSGTPGIDKVLTSDATGIATWQIIPEIEGQYSGLNSQTPTTTTPIVLTFEAEDITEKGITHSTTVNPGEFTATLAKTYTWQIGPQWQKTTAAGTDTLDFFVELNTGSGFVKVTNSNVKVISDSKSSDVIFLSASIPMAVGDIIRFMFRSSNPPNLQTTFFPATASVPATPSQILNVFSGN